jgi:hypothetical protein
MGDEPVLHNSTWVLFYPSFGDEYPASDYRRWLLRATSVRLKHARRDWTCLTPGRWLTVVENVCVTNESEESNKNKKTTLTGMCALTKSNVVVMEPSSTGRLWVSADEYVMIDHVLMDLCQKEAFEDIRRVVVQSEVLLPVLLPLVAEYCAACHGADKTCC